MDDSLGFTSAMVVGDANYTAHDFRAQSLKLKA
jgi:hypothetical protein